MITLASVIDQFQDDFLSEYQDRLRPNQIGALHAISMGLALEALLIQGVPPLLSGNAREKEWVQTDLKADDGRVTRPQHRAAAGESLPAGKRCFSWWCRRL